MRSPSYASSRSTASAIATEASGRPIRRILSDIARGCPSSAIVFPSRRTNHATGKGGWPDKRMPVDSFRQDAWIPAVEGAGLKACRIHDMRHAYIQWLVSLKVNALLIGPAAGHQDPKTTAIHLGRDPKLFQGVRDAFDPPRRIRRIRRGTQSKDDLEELADPDEHKTPKPEPRKKPEHTPGSGPVIKRRLPKSHPQSLSAEPAGGLPESTFRPS